MKIIFFGDIVGRDARDAVIEQVPLLKEKLKLDFVVVNAENAAHGFGITEKICKELYAAGVDCITTGNHIWDQREIIAYIGRDKNLLRPINFPEGAPGNGLTVLETQRGRKLMVVNLMARLFMDAMDDPFAAMERVFTKYRLGGNVDAILVDFHGEATSEKMAMGHYCDGRASLVVGTHSHVPTADLHVMKGGTAYQTDAGMCGTYQSVIGMDIEIATNRFIRKVPGERLRPADGPVTLCGVYIETDDDTGLCTKALPVRIGGVLDQALPEAA